MSSSITSAGTAPAQYKSPVTAGDIEKDISQLMQDLQAYSGSLGGSPPAASTVPGSSNHSMAQAMQEMMRLLPQMAASGQCAPSQPAGQGAVNQTPALTSAYKQMMKDLSANGTSPQTLRQDGQNFLSALQQSAGDYDAGKVGSQNANLNTLKDEISANPLDLAQVHNNAQALANQATNSGTADLASAARNIANSTQDRTSNGAASLQALQNAAGQTRAEDAPATSTPAASTPSTESPTVGAPSTPAGTTQMQMMQEMMQVMQQLLQMMEGSRGAPSQPATGERSASPSAPAGGSAAPGGQPAGAGTSAGGPQQMTQEIMQMLQTVLSMMEQMSSGVARPG